MGSFAGQNKLLYDMVRFVTLLLRSDFFLWDRTRFFCATKHSFSATELCLFVIFAFLWWDKARLFGVTKQLSFVRFFCGTALQVQLSELECSLSNKRTCIYELEEQVQKHDRALHREQVFSVGRVPFGNRSPFRLYRYDLCGFACVSRSWPHS